MDSDRRTGGADLDAASRLANDESIVQLVVLTGGPLNR